MAQDIIVFATSQNQSSFCFRAKLQMSEMVVRMAAVQLRENCIIQCCIKLTLRLQRLIFFKTYREKNNLGRLQC